MKNFFLVLLLILISNTAFAKLRVMNPDSIKLLNLSKKGENKFNKNLKACEKIWDKMSDGLEEEQLTKKERNLISNFDETFSSYWDILGDGDSWYCGGGTKKVNASSYLKSQGKTSYKPKNAHDLNYKSVWVEGVKGYGKGEYLLYTFSGSCPRITEINIVNGHVKSKSAWKKNSRVKTLKMYLNNKPYAKLNLKDIRGVQTFKVDPIGNENRENYEALKKMPDWTIKFEILDVYKNSKYDDTVISEIYFDGIDVH